jgi:hypothetical protein
MRKNLMPCVTHAAQVDLRFSDAARAVANFGVRICSCDFTRERFHLLR